MKKKIKIIFSSHLSKDENNEFIKHVNKTVGCKHEVYCYENHNQYSLTEVYNKGLNKHKDDESILVFCHLDIIFNTKNWGYKLLKHFNNNTEYDILGVAGTTHMLDSGVWWQDKTKMMGVVNHTDGTRKWQSAYSNRFDGIRDSVLVDGLFIVVNSDNLINGFDESYKGFHYYDISFCIRNYLDGNNIGVITDIDITHKSIGETNQQWEDNRKQFVEEYKDEFPVIYKPHDPKDISVLICCQFFREYTGSEMSNYEMAKNLVNQGYNVTLIANTVGEPLLSKAKKEGIDVRSLANAPNYFIADNKLQYKGNEKTFDIIHINHKPIGETILKMYPNTPAVMHIRSEVIPVFEEPIVDDNIVSYISIRDSVREYIKMFGISDDDIVHIDNPFDDTRFNTDYEKPNNDKKINLFIGTCDHLRKNILFDMKDHCEKNDELLWIIGKDSQGYVSELTSSNNIEYFGIQKKVEEYIKKSDITVGIFNGRSTIEGWLCGKDAIVYTVDKEGKILNKEFKQVPDDVDKYKASESVKKVIELYNRVLNY